jgi:undecaprenyl pyrophosphate synthase
MNIRCFIGIHDNEPFGTGIKLLDIIEKAVDSKVEKFNMEIHKGKILYVVNAQALDDIIPNTLSANAKKYKVENSVVKDTICLRCGKITMVIKLCREVMESIAEKVITKIMINEKRQAKAEELLNKASGFSKCI